MIAPWLLYATLVATLFGCAALGIARIAQLRRAPIRAIWLGALVLSVAAPIVGNLVAKPAAIGATAGTPFLTISSRFSIDTPLLLLWGAASLLMIARLVASVLLMRVCRRRWREAALDGTPILLTAETGPALVGLTHPRPVIPAWALKLDSRERALMLLHETEHARAGDPVLQAIGAISVASMPWNPALWWLVRRLRLAVEIDCDARVLRSGADARAYASLLLTVGERMSRTPFAWASALAEPRSLLERRILAMTTPTPPRRPLLAIAGFGLVAGLAIIVACETPLPDQVAPAPHATPREALVAGQALTPTLILDARSVGDTVNGIVTRHGVPVRYRVAYRTMSDTSAIRVKNADGTIFLLSDPITVRDSVRVVQGHAIRP